MMKAYEEKKKKLTARGTRRAKIANRSGQHNSGLSEREGGWAGQLDWGLGQFTSGARGGGYPGSRAKGTSGRKIEAGVVLENRERTIIRDDPEQDNEGKKEKNEKRIAD